MTTSELNDYNQEIEMAGLYSGGVLGGLVLGAFGDLINSEVNAMAWYITGAVLGAIGGAIAGRLFRMIALRPPAEEGSYTERVRRKGHEPAGGKPRSVV